MARFGRRKKFEARDGFPTFPVEKRVETIVRFVIGKNLLDLEEEKSLKQRMDFQQSECKKVLKLWLGL